MTTTDVVDLAALDLLDAADHIARELELSGSLRRVRTLDLPPRDPVHLPADDLPLHPAVRAMLHAQFPQGLYRHQHAAIAAVLRGEHVVIGTPTSSGKSLVFAAPMADAIVRDPKATALFMYPQKALANDQLGSLRHLLGGVAGLADPERIVARYDGGTPKDDRKTIREQARVVLSNPDMVHASLLAHDEHWTRFWKNLRIVVVDEAHDYRGIFGSGVALVIRRIRAMARRHGANPVFVSASATIRDAVGHLRTLTGLDFTLVGPDEDGSRQGRRAIHLVTPAQHEWQLTRELTQRLVQTGRSVLTFCGSRRAAELLHDEMPKSMKSDGRTRVYRAGLSATEREEVEAGLRSGSIRAVFSTSALELGIDLGMLDAVVCVGIPPTMMSLWQRIGRVGRGGRDGVVFLIPAQTPRDAWLAAHPDRLFAPEAEPLAMNLRNGRLVRRHLACAMAEAGSDDALDLDVLGEELAHANALRREGRLDDSIFYDSEPHHAISLRGNDDARYDLVLDDESIGEIDGWHLLREAPPQAIYFHGGRRHRVVRVLGSNPRKVVLAPERSPNRTQCVVQTTIRPRRARRVTQWDGVSLDETNLEVTDRLVQITETKPDGTVAARFDSANGLRPLRMPTEGILLKIDAARRTAIERRASSPVGAGDWRAVGRLMRAMLPAVIGPCDANDYAAWVDVARDGTVRLALYDTVYDGVELAVQAFDRIAELLAAVAERVRTCDCADDDGCLRCIQNPDAPDVASKRAVREVADALRDLVAAEPTRVVVLETDLIAEVHEPSKACATCGAEAHAPSRFCSNCGSPFPEA